MVDAKPDGRSGPLGRMKTPKAVAKLPRQVRDELTRRLRRNKGAFREEDVQVVEAPLLKRAVGASALGNCMEWFDSGSTATSPPPSARCSSPAPPRAPSSSPRS
ncbi:hypothetical protein SFUMM280S_04827 [Streptomyces fumanus]